MRTYKYICKKCKANFDELEAWVDHNKTCESFGYERILLDIKKVNSGVSPEKKAMKSKPKAAEANEQELKTSSSAKKTVKQLKKDLEPSKSE